ncbi:MAG: hypothetical protein QM756_27510 [Polyangiaceae bacterium]
MLPRVSALLLCLVLPALWLKRELGTRADTWATAWGRDAAEALAPLAPRSSSSPAEQAALRESLEGFERAELALAAAPVAVETAGKSKRGKASKPKGPSGVFVSAANVLRLANAAAMPHAVYVAALGARPAGLRLIGVSGLGIGMRDGDVLTRVLGADVSSVAEVVQRVVAARNRRAREISGEFWRDGARWSLVVEQPYIDAPPPAASAR